MMMAKSSTQGANYAEGATFMSSQFFHIIIVYLIIILSSIIKYLVVKLVEMSNV